MTRSIKNKIKSIKDAYKQEFDFIKKKKEHYF